ncbi:hypothetical protein J2X72_002556 [Phyllobacterium sp. 1468]|uniref:TY-Chap domain-containing protein n=1 Tax=Phyllobacterium sp. 1468 TaxID=2817759 RepID=UPI002857FB3A|nr:hypothetical protein [Phyllobacterium sp. 1468]MDR6633756.1 hypothetical protein [Phyllobacterium sp. 1468]
MNRTFLTALASMRATAMAAVLIMAVGRVVAPDMSGATESTSADAFIEAYRCPVVARLARMHTGALARLRPLDRYLIIDLEGQRYVQCRFVENDSKAQCEASSGYYGPKEGEPGSFRMSMHGLRALAGLGFSTDGSGGNYGLVIETPGPRAYAKVAETMLAALQLGYGANIHSRMVARSAQEPDEELQSCASLPSG